MTDAKMLEVWMFQESGSRKDLRSCYADHPHLSGNAVVGPVQRGLPTQTTTEARGLGGFKNDNCFVAWDVSIKPPASCLGARWNESGR